ncbi:MAG: esterase-like activity of phytase family protein [Pseudomonadota bacterium]
MTRTRLAAIFAIAVACADASAGENDALRASPLDFSPWETENLEFRGALAVSPPFDEFGGLSGLIKTGPREFLAVSDRASWVRFGVELQNGRLTGLTHAEAAMMPGAPDEDSEEDGWDPEGLTRGAGGEIWASFERDHRLQVFETAEAAPGPSLRRVEWESFSENGGLEALATDADGALWALRERAEEAGQPFPVFVISDAGWRQKVLPRRGPYRPTGADFGADGWMYVAERAFSFTGGFRFRLSRYKWGAGETPLESEDLITLPSESLIDNIEGVAVWEEAGETRILLISDDNFSLFQRNVFALFALRR